RPEIYTLSLHDALPICVGRAGVRSARPGRLCTSESHPRVPCIDHGHQHDGADGGLDVVPRAQPGRPWTDGGSDVLAVRGVLPLGLVGSAFVDRSYGRGSRRDGAGDDRGDAAAPRRIHGLRTPSSAAPVVLIVGIARRNTQRAPEGEHRYVTRTRPIL